MGRAVFLLSLAAFASAASMRAVDPLLPLVAREFGTTTGDASFAVTGFALSYGLLQIVGGALGDRFGRYRTVAAASLVSALSSAACAAAPSLGALVAARLAAGATVGALIPLSLAWIGDSFPYERRQPLLARFLIGQMAGFAFGTAASGLLAERFGWRAIFVALAVSLAAVGAALWLELRRNPAVGAAPGEPVSVRLSLARMPGLFARPWVRTVLVTAFVEGLLIFGAFAFVPSYVQRRYGFGPGAGGSLAAAFAAGGFVYSLLAKRLLRRLREPGMALAGGAALALGYAVLGAVPSAALATLCVAGLGVGYYAFHTTVQTNATQMAPEARGSSIALFACMLFLGQASGVWLAGRMVDRAGAGPVFALAAAGLAMLTVTFRRRLAARP